MEEAWGKPGLGRRVFALEVDVEERRSQDWRQESEKGDGIRGGEARRAYWTFREIMVAGKSGGDITNISFELGKNEKK